MAAVGSLCGGKFVVVVSFFSVLSFSARRHRFFLCGQLMERLKRHVCHSQARWSEGKEKKREKEGEEMTLCLYECLRAVGLQRHYAR